MTRLRLQTFSRTSASVGRKNRQTQLVGNHAGWETIRLFFYIKLYQPGASGRHRMASTHPGCSHGPPAAILRWQPPVVACRPDRAVRCDPGSGRPRPVPGSCGPRSGPTGPEPGISAPSLAHRGPVAADATSRLPGEQTGFLPVFTRLLKHPIDTRTCYGVPVKTSTFEKASLGRCSEIPSNSMAMTVPEASKSSTIPGPTSSDSKGVPGASRI